MMKRSTEKYQEVSDRIRSLSIESCIMLGLFGMARTVPMLKHIARHEQFEELDKFGQFIIFGVQKLLYRSLEFVKEAKKGLAFCNAVIPLLETYDFSKSADPFDRNLMGVTYPLMEEWFYFLGFFSVALDDPELKDMGRLATAKLTMIDFYLCNKYADRVEPGLLQKKVNEDPSIAGEIKRIDQDIAFVTELDFLRDKKRVEQRMALYMKCSSALEEDPFGQ